MSRIMPMFVVVLAVSCSPAYKTLNAGRPWQNKIQAIPGKVECEFYNEGGEGIAYHDSDSLTSVKKKLELISRMCVVFARCAVRFL
jgi:hypothetical protein